jgi:hypothetical protein
LSTDEPDAAFVDLGAVTLPFWNPDTQKYERASAELGRVALAAPTLPESPSAPTITVQDVSETPWLRADSPVLTGLGVGLIVGAAVALAVGLRKKRG